MSYFEVVGPFELEPKVFSTGVKMINRGTTASSLWAEECAGGWEEYNGCYVFGMTNPRGITPWYVGKTANTFEKECFQADKIIRYNEVLADYHKGKPVMFLVVWMGRWTKVKMPRCIDELETLLIQKCYKRNPKLQQVQKTKNGPDWYIDSVTKGTKGRNSDNIKDFISMVGF